MSKVLERIMNDLRVSLPGAMDGAIMHALGLAMFEFCDISGAWTSPCKLIVGAATRYTVEPEDGYPLRLSEITDDAGRGYDAEFLPPDAIRFHSASSDGGPLTVTLVVAPDPSTPLAMPDELILAYQQPLMDGAKGRMMGQIAKPWSNAPMAQFHQRSFRAGALRARAHAARKRTIAGQRWSFPQTFAVRRTR